MTIYMSKRNLRFLFDIMIFDKFQLTRSSLSNKICSHYDANSVIFSKINKIRLKNLHVIDIR